jgi:AraC-like DNA-binding protein/quercetin dioxygenase-like cupin family protein
LEKTTAVERRLSEMIRAVCLPELVLAGDFVVKPGWVLNLRSMKEYELIYFPKGTGSVYTIGDHSYWLDRPGFVFIRPGVPHTCRFDPEQPTRHLFVRFAWPGDISEASASGVLAMDGPAWIPAEKPTVIPLMLKRIMEIVADKSWNGEERCRLLFYSVLCELEETIRPAEGREPEKIPLQLLRAKEYMMQNIRRSSLTIAEVAAAIGWTHEHFSRQYARYYAITPREAVMKERVELACQMLIQENWSIKQVAYWVGFDDEHYFSRCFRKIKGMSASSFREKYANPHYRHLAQVKEAGSYPLNRYYRFDRF